MNENDKLERQNSAWQNVKHVKLCSAGLKQLENTDLESHLNFCVCGTPLRLGLGGREETGGGRGGEWGGRGGGNDKSVF